MPIYTFNVRRSGNLTVPCSVPWQLEGTGTNPIPGSAFVGGVLPSGTANFAANAVLAQPSFELLAGTRPASSQSGRLILRAPVGCKIDPNADRHGLTLKGEGVDPDPDPDPPGDLYEPIKLADLPDSRRTNVTTLGTRTGTPGMNFVLGADVSNSTLTLRGTGSAGQEIVFRGDSDSSAATGLRTLTNCTINIEGDFCGLARLVLENCRVLINNKSDFVTRCAFIDRASSQQSDDMIDIDKGDKSSRFSCHKCDFIDNRGCLLAKTEAIEMVFAYNLVEKQGVHATSGSSTFLIYVGSSEDTTNIKTLMKVHHNLIVDCNINDLTEIKASDVEWHDNTIERCGGAGLRIRHGMRNKMRRNIFLEAGNGPLITVRTGPHEVTENQFYTGSGAAGGGNIDLFAGHLHWDYEIWKDQRVPKAENNWQASGHCLVVANYAEVRVGVESGNSKSPPEVKHGYYADGNNVGPTSGASRNRAVTLMTYEKNTERKAVAGYDIDVKLTRMTRGIVGLRAP
jgi:hypothetical protein